MSPDDDPPPKKKYPRASWEPPDPDEEPATVRAKKKPEPSGPTKSDPSGATKSAVVSSATSDTASGATKSAATQGPTRVSEPSIVVEKAPETYVRDTAPGGYTPPADVSAQPAYSQQASSAASEASQSQPSAFSSQPAEASSSSYSPVEAVSTSGSYSQPVEAVPTSIETAPVSTSAIVASEAVPGAVSTSGARSMSRDDEPILPLPTSLGDGDDALRESIGAKPKKRKPPPPPDDFGDDDLDGDGPKKRGKLWMFVMLFIVLGLTIGAFVVFGHINKQRYMIACEPQQVIAKQGRGFPPWGERSIDDDGMWKPIKIPPEAECRERETEDIDELSRWYLDILMDRASSMLTAREVTKIDEAAGMLDQALLHARQPERRSERRDIERLLGDVGYWGASAKLKDAAGALTDAAKQFDSAAAQRPRHVSDASAWATYVRKIADELKAGPNGALTAFPPTPPVADHQPAPPGVALPVEPPAGSGSAEPPPVPVDAGLPTGGVLL